MRGRTPLVALVFAAAGLCAVATAARGDNPGQLAYSAPSGIRLINDDGTRDKAVRGSVPDDDDPSWSPDGRQIAVDSDGSIAVIDVASGRRQLVFVRVGTQASWPAWTHDGRRIVFSVEIAGDWTLFSAHPDGSGLERADRVRAFYPEYAAGGMLTYTAWDDAKQRNALFIRRGATDKELDTRDEAWGGSLSPDAKTLAFMSSPVGSPASNTEVHVIGSDGTNEIALTHNRFWDGDPDYSPDGSRIAYDTGRWGWSEIAVMNADGSYKRRVTRELGGDACCPAWRP